MNQKRSLLLLTVILLSAASGFSQDSLMSATRKRILESGVLPPETHLVWPADSVTITDAQHFDLLTRSVPLMTRTGNLGGASYDPFAAGGSFKLLDDGFNRFDPYLINPLENRFMLRNKRFTHINYHLGSRKEQHIRLRHEQVIRPGFIAGLDYGGLGSPGDYYRQLNSIRNFDIYTLYSSLSGKYSLYASYTSNKAENEENGGIKADSLFEEASDRVDTKTIPVNLDNAQVRYKTRDYLVRQRIRLLKTAQQDSLPASNNTGFFLSQSTWWQRRSHLFQSENPDSGYFANFYNDTTVTYDSSFFNDLNNRLAIQYHWQTENGRFLEVGAGAAHQYTEYTSGDSIAYLQTTSATGAIKSVGTNWSASADLAIGVSGDYSGAYQFNAYGYFHPDSAAYIVGASLSSSSLPHVAQEQFYRSNHFVWSRDDDNEQRTQLKAQLKLPSRAFSAEIEWLQRKNYITYADESFLPVLNKESINLLAARIHYTQDVGRFGFPLQLTVQASGDEKRIPVQSFIFKTGFYYKNRFFKKALTFCSGVDISMASKSYLHGYMPATGSFYVQNEKKTGNYPYVDLYVNLGVGTAILFIKIEHLNAEMSSRDYYAAYHYPMTGRAFKFGVVWNLAD